MSETKYGAFHNESVTEILLFDELGYPRTFTACRKRNKGAFHNDSVTVQFKRNKRKHDHSHIKLPGNIILTLSYRTLRPITNNQLAEIYWTGELVRNIHYVYI